MRPIDADALNARFEELKGHPKNTLADVIFLDGAMSVVDVAPTLDYAHVVHGEWIEQEETFGDIYYTCSVCKEDWFIPDGTPAENFMHFCPRCGARMDGKEEATSSEI